MHNCLLNRPEPLVEMLVPDGDEKKEAAVYRALPAATVRGGVCGDAERQEGLQEVLR